MHPGFVVATEMLPVPKTTCLAERQLSGARCVWCRAGAKVPLGPRLAVTADGLLRWHPGGCRRCIRREARAAYDDHARWCVRCMRLSYSRLVLCADAQALHDLAHESAPVVRESIREP